MKTIPYNTNLAAEFFVLSMLYRKGANAMLTLGNKKSVDIAVLRDSGPTLTVDVKGVSGSYDWPADNVEVSGKKSHFLVLVSFEGSIENHLEVPSVWVIPARKIEPFFARYKTRTVLSRAKVKEEGKRYLNRWEPLTGG